MKTLCVVVILVFAGCPLPSFAGSNLYCKIITVNGTTPSGDLERLSERKNGVWAPMKGSEFVVERSTGLMLGKHVGNDKHSWETKVIDLGYNGQSYKAFSQIRTSTGPDWGKGQYLEVQTWEEGEKKPFVLVYREVFLGYCTL